MAVRSTVKKQGARALRWLAAQVRGEVQLSAGTVQAPAEKTRDWKPEPVVEAPAPAQPEASGSLSADDRALMDALSAVIGPAWNADAPEEAGPIATPTGDLREQVIEMIHTVYDPEIPVDIFDLGLIYDVDIDEEQGVNIRMTLTSPNCPAAQSLPSEVEAKVSMIEGVSHAVVEVVFDPPWTPDLMSEEAKLELNIGY